MLVCSSPVPLRWCRKAGERSQIQRSTGPEHGHAGTRSTDALSPLDSHRRRKDTSPICAGRCTSDRAKHRFTVVNVSQRGCDFCRDNQNMSFDHAEQVASNDVRGDPPAVSTMRLAVSGSGRRLRTASHRCSQRGELVRLPHLTAAPDVGASEFVTLGGDGLARDFLLAS